ncbi:DUF4236 domain-containing protein [Novosphingobium profundi]|uniref:DUF4236 domain-containing protein n=1 Tax=Novosphingobium profundi TaxID=1774954 RepID=UPI001BDA2382|nr:DUF4236 domain-containing protein [Novosphingobium profundi]MBT0671475.1 DUF4236 domain-containing protein [Novosphingobium profundi]
MGFRFSKRIQIMPGVRLNLSKSGASWSLGPRGASVSVGKRGVYGNVGLPGTGLSWRERLDRPSGRSSTSASTRNAPSMPSTVSARLVDNQIQLFDGNDYPLDPSLISAAKSAMKEEIRAFLHEHETERNGFIDSLKTLHHDVPQSVRQAVGPANGKPQREQFASQGDFMAALMTWNADRANAGCDDDHIAEALLQALGELQWPAETNIAISLQGGRLLLDVDLPEIEDMPTSRWKALISKMSLEEKPISQKDICTLYRDHVSSIMIRLIGHSMASSGAIQSVGISAYTQRASATGHVTDEYVASVTVTRSAWNGINLPKIHEIDPDNLLRHFGAKLEANARGKLLTQTPLT